MLEPQRHRSPTLALGRLVATPGALERLSRQDIANAVQRHSQRDWGELCREDRDANDRALHDGTRVLSAYQGSNGTKFWIITEADRSVTTVLLPEEY